MLISRTDPLFSMMRNLRSRPWQPWRLDAACRGLDPEIFHPKLIIDVAAPKEICAGCPVREECLEHAIEYNERKGVWGGTNERERRLLINARIQEKRERKKASA